ncbi:MAG: T9SS type A sorting domain-containing protein [Ignavibacteria bacterium]|nr:T9SS type A sorting domain-containing protein [Ignavibacteria bacterium]
MNKLLISLLFIFIYVTQSFSIGLEWSSRFNGAGNSLDMAYTVALDPAGNIIVTGYSTGAGTGKDYKTIKYNSLGNILWEASFNGPINGGDYSNALAIDNSGNIYVTGRVDYGTTSADIVTIKYNSSGVQQWFARFNGTANLFDEGRSIKVLSDGSVIVSGKTTSTGSGSDFITIKYNSDGTEAWKTLYNGTGNTDDYIVSLDCDAAGNIYVGGCSIGANSGLDFMVIKYNSSGVMQWQKRYNGAGNGGDAVVGLKVDSENNIVAGGFVDMGSAQGYNFLVLKYNSSGNLIWEAQYDGTSHFTDIATAMTVDAMNNIYLTGVTTQIMGTIPDSNYATVKFDKNGVIQWTVFYNGPNNSVDVSRTVFVDNSLNVYISGSSKGAGSDDYVTIKYNSSGVAQWIMSYNGTGNSNDYSTSVVADDIGNVYVTGRSIGVGSNYDYATLKYGNLVGIEPVNSQIPDKFSLWQNYPNPFNPSTKIKFSIPIQNYTEIKIYDISGNLIKVFKLGNLAAAYYEYSIDLSGFSSGVYFYKLHSGNFSAAKKMILIK